MHSLTNHYTKSIIDAKLTDLTRNSTTKNNDIDLTKYYTKIEADNTFNRFYNKTQVDLILSNVVQSPTLTNYYDISSIN